MAVHVRKGDLVEVLAGEAAGQRGKVLAVFLDRQKVLIEGINRVFRHTRRSKKNPTGGRIQKEACIHISNVLPVNPKTDKPTRVAFRTLEDGRKVRVARTDGTVLGELRKVKATSEG